MCVQVVVARRIAEPSHDTVLVQQHNDDELDSPSRRTTVEPTALPALNGSPHKVASAPVQNIGHGLSPCKTGMQQGLVAYAKFVTSASGRTLAVCLLAGYLAIAITGVLRMKTELFPEDVMPVHSPLIEMFKIRHEYMWKDYHPISVLVNRPLNYSDPDDVHAINVCALPHPPLVYIVQSLVREMEQLPDALDSDFTQYWVRDYVPWRNEQDEWAAVDDELIVDQGLNGSLRLDKLDEFLAEPQNEFYQSMIVFSKNE
jgi:hypothetical protein